MQNYKSSFFEEMKMKGFAEIPDLKVHQSELFNLYNLLEALLTHAEDPNSHTYFQAFDAALRKHLILSQLGLNIEGINLSKIYKGGASPQIASFQYLHDFKKCLDENKIIIGPFIEKFILELDKLSNFLTTKFSQVLGDDDVVFLLKVSKYQNQLEKNQFLMPFHCDRTLITVIVDTQEDANSKLLLTKDPQFSPTSFYTVKQADLPLAFTGAAGFKSFGVPPTFHAVTNFDDSVASPTRYSLILFALMKSALS